MMEASGKAVDGHTDGFDDWSPQQLEDDSIVSVEAEDGAV